MKWRLLNTRQKKKNEAKKAKKKKKKKKVWREVERKSQDCCITSELKNYIEILLSAQVWSSEANILHQDPKAMKWTNCKGVFGKF